MTCSYRQRNRRIAYVITLQELTYNAASASRLVKLIISRKEGRASSSISKLLSSKQSIVAY
jgi:hypothetical protein